MEFLSLFRLCFNLAAFRSDMILLRKCHADDTCFLVSVQDWTLFWLITCYFAFGTFGSEDHVMSS